MKNKKIKNDYKSIAYQINNGKNKNNTTQTINKDNRETKKKENYNQNKELDSSAFVMVPINHPKINEIIKLLNENEISIPNLYDDKNSSKIEDKKSNESSKFIITLNDIITNFSTDKIIIPENSIISPLAKDYIKQKKIEVIYTKN